MSNPSKAAIKAKGLYNKFYWSIVEATPEENKGNAKRCAVIHCDEVLALLDKIDETKLSTVFYTEVKNEIQSL